MIENVKGNLMMVCERQDVKRVVRAETPAEIHAGIPSELRIANVPSPYVREYDDGAGWPNMTAAKERAFRRGFLEEARRAVREWTSGDLELFDPFGQEEAAYHLRWRTRERYTVYRSAYGLGCAGRKTHHVGYRPEHVVPAARLRGRHHALAYIVQASEDIQDDETFDHWVLPAWLAAVERWAAKPIKKNALSAPPPRPSSFM